MNWMEFRQLIDEHFNYDELQTLCFDLGIDYESLVGEGKTGKIRELVNYTKRHNRLNELLSYLRKVRENVKWPDLTNSKSSEKEDEIDNEGQENPIRTAVWNALLSKLWKKRTFLNSHNNKPPLIDKFSEKLWGDFINKPIDSRPKEANLILQEIRYFFFSYPDAKWRAYLEYILNYWNGLNYYKPLPINQEVNVVLEREGSNLRYIPRYLRGRIFLYGEISETDLSSTSDSVGEIPEDLRTKIYQEAWENYTDFSSRKTFIKKEFEAWQNQQNQS